MNIIDITDQIQQYYNYNYVIAYSCVALVDV